MILIGDNTIYDYMNTPKIRVIKYGNISAEEYLNSSSISRVEDDIIVYSFGKKDLKRGITNTELLSLYDRFPRGKIGTYFIIPPNGTIDLGEEGEEFFEDNVSFIYNFVTDNEMIRNGKQSKESRNIFNEYLLTLLDKPK